MQIHIIEARDLNAENNDGTSDPVVVYIECFGQQRNTVVIKQVRRVLCIALLYIYVVSHILFVILFAQVTSCVFGEVFIFNLKDLNKEAFEDGFVRVSGYDSNRLGMAGGGNTMIGAYAIDSTMVYTMNKHHELYRQWVSLMDDEDKEDVGVQGYLKLTIQVI